MDDINVLLNVLAQCIDTAHSQLPPDKYLYMKFILSVSGSLIRARQQKHMSVEEFAEFMDVEPKVVQNWERGNYNFNLKELSVIFGKLDIDADLVLKRTDKQVEDN